MLRYISEYTEIGANFNNPMNALLSEFDVSFKAIEFVGPLPVETAASENKIKMTLCHRKNKEVLEAMLNTSGRHCMEHAVLKVMSKLPQSNTASCAANELLEFDLVKEQEYESKGNLEKGKVGYRAHLGLRKLSGGQASHNAWNTLQNGLCFDAMSTAVYEVYQDMEPARKYKASRLALNLKRQLELLSEEVQENSSPCGREWTESKLLKKMWRFTGICEQNLSIAQAQKKGVLTSEEREDLENLFKQIENFKAADWYALMGMWTTNA